MFRFADRIGEELVRDHALQHIGLILSAENVIWELFGPFTFLHPAVAKIQLEFVKAHLEAVVSNPCFSYTMSAAEQHTDLFPGFEKCKRI